MGWGELSKLPALGERIPSLSLESGGLLVCTSSTTKPSSSASELFVLCQKKIPTILYFSELYVYKYLHQQHFLPGSHGWSRSPPVDRMFFPSTSRASNIQRKANNEKNPPAGITFSFSARYSSTSELVALRLKSNQNTHTNTHTHAHTHTRTHTHTHTHTLSLWNTRNECRKLLLCGLCTSSRRVRRLGQWIWLEKCRSGTSIRLQW